MAATMHRSVRRIRRPLYVPNARVASDEQYENARDCCCHKLGRMRPHLPSQCRDIA